MGQIEDRTVWDVTTNGSVGELLLLGVSCFILAGMYSVVYLHVKIKFLLQKLRVRRN